VSIGGVDAKILYFGAAPTEIAGLFQLNVQIPPNTPTGSTVPVLLTVGNNTSPASATVAVN
jgi:uncharacterized protein (TIGR03437 family)